MPEKPSVRRCLFGRPDHDLLKKELEKALREVDDGRGEKKWNFDFDIGRPIDGRYKWTKVSEDSYVPEFYRKGYSTRARTFCGLRSNEFLPAVSQTTQLDKSSQTSHGNTSTDVRTHTETDSSEIVLVHSEGHVCSTTSGNSTTSSDSSPVQSTITDFMKPRKRKRESRIERNIKSPRI